MYITTTNKGRLVRADYEGGPYIELSFGTSAFRPTEVINVWDYETDKPEDPRLSDPKTQRKAVRYEVDMWIADNDKEWPEWYGEYLTNATY